MLVFLIEGGGNVPIIRQIRDAPGCQPFCRLSRPREAITVATMISKSSAAELGKSTMLIRIKENALWRGIRQAKPTFKHDAIKDTLLCAHCCCGNPRRCISCRLYARRSSCCGSVIHRCPDCGKDYRLETDIHLQVPAEQQRASNLRRSPRKPLQNGYCSLHC